MRPLSFSARKFLHLINLFTFVWRRHPNPIKQKPTKLKVRGGGTAFVKQSLSIMKTILAPITPCAHKIKKKKTWRNCANVFAPLISRFEENISTVVLKASLLIYARLIGEFTTLRGDLSCANLRGGTFLVTAPLGNWYKSIKHAIIVGWIAPVGTAARMGRAEVKLHECGPKSCREGWVWAAMTRDELDLSCELIFF